VLAFGAAPVKTAVLAGPNPARTSDMSRGAGREKHSCISDRLCGRINADLDLRCLDHLANCGNDLTDGCGPFRAF
jgi:hypothetical protein